MGTFLSISNGWAERLSPRARAMLALADVYYARREACDFGTPARQRPEQACVLQQGGPGVIAIVGDSYAAAVAPGFAQSARATARRLIVFSVSGCAPIDGLGRLTPYGADCAESRSKILPYLIAHQEIGTVVLAARWIRVFSDGPFDNGEGGVGRLEWPAPSPGERKARIEGLRSLAAQLGRAGKRVVLVYPIPEAGWGVPKYLTKAEQRGLHPASLTVDAARIRAYAAPAVAALEIGYMPGLSRIDPVARLCGRRCALTRESQPLYFDDNHLTAEGAMLAVR